MYKPLAFFAVVTCATVAHAQTAGSSQQNQNPMSFEALARAKAGSWAEYTMSMKGQPPLKMKYALVQKSASGMALEIDSATPMGEVMMHMAFEPAGSDAWKMVKARMQFAQNPPEDVPAAQLASGGIKKSDLPGKLIGSETVTTAVGKFECKKYSRVMPKEAGGSTVEMWMSDKAVPTGMVKMVDSRGIEVVLSAVGSDAKAKMDLSKPAPTTLSGPSGTKTAPPAKK
jgi:hypothetical protein